MFHVVYGFQVRMFQIFEVVYSSSGCLRLLTDV